MNAVTPQDFRRQAKINILQWRINRVQTQLEKVQASTPEATRLATKFMSLIQQRNALRTPEEVAGVERVRGLV